MSITSAYIVGIGLVSPAGIGVAPLLDVLRSGERRIGQLTVFPGPEGVATLPVAEIPGVVSDEELPRTHVLALMAAKEALADAGLTSPPDAIVLGGTTGGMPVTEQLIKEEILDLHRYRWHGVGTVAEHVASEIGCKGPTLTVATACSSGAVALKIALELLRRGEATTVLAGGVDALCRMTYHGFNMLKLIDPEGAKPFDADRAGMTVGEGAAMVVLTAAQQPPEGAIAVLAGGGLSCDAYHSSSPHPEGAGALAAMRAAFDDAGVAPDEIDYVALHGTGTADNDSSEAKALLALFGATLGASLPHHSSVKGTLGHAVGAAGAFGAIIAALAIRHGLVPGNVGCQRVDPELSLSPVPSSISGQSVDMVLSNAFGFGGNNAALVVAKPDWQPGGRRHEDSVDGSKLVATGRFTVLGASCVTGVGLSSESLEAFERGESLVGAIDGAELVSNLPKGRLRRVKRLTRLAMALTAELGHDGEPPSGVLSIILGTCWGTLSETYDFLRRLFDSDERFSSPTDFVGTVHNSVAGQLAMWLGATGSNITATTGNTSFEDALFIAALLTSLGDQAGDVLVLGLDEAQELLTPRLQPLSDATALSDGGGALLLRPAQEGVQGPILWPAFRGRAEPGTIDELIAALGGVDSMRDSIGELWFSVPEAESTIGEAQLSKLQNALGPELPTRDVRRLVGDYPTATAAATALACARLEKKMRGDRGILIVSLGRRVVGLVALPERVT